MIRELGLNRTQRSKLVSVDELFFKFPTAATRTLEFATHDRHPSSLLLGLVSNPKLSSLFTGFHVWRIEGVIAKVSGYPYNIVQ